MTLADLKAEALAQVDQLRRERDEARQLAADFTKILVREGDVSGAYERRLAEALRERDEARAEVERLERLFQQTHGVHHTWVDARHKVAERQREACAKYAFCQACANEVSGAPLVTEGEK